MRVLSPRDYKRQAWKNGQGQTTEILAEPGTTGFAWRISIADIGQSGPFSDFAGYARHIALIEGKGCELRFADGGVHRLDQPYRAFAFDGGSSLHCALIDGPIRDFNLMATKAAFAARLDFLTTDAETTADLPRADDLILHVLAGGMRIGDVNLPQDHTMHLRGRADRSAILDAGAVVAVASLDHKQGHADED